MNRLVRSSVLKELDLIIHFIFKQPKPGNYGEPSKVGNVVGFNSCSVRILAKLDRFR